MLSTKLRLVAAATLIGVTLPSGPALEAQTGLFTPADPTVVQSGRSDDNVLRSRVVSIDRGQLGRARDVALSRATAPAGGASTRAGAMAEPGGTLLLNLFDDVTVRGVVEWTDATFSGGYSVSGGLAGDPLGTMTLVVNGERIVGSVRTTGGVYRIRSAGGGLFTVSEVEEPPLRCGVEGPHPETPDHRH